MAQQVQLQIREAKRRSVRDFPPYDQQTPPFLFQVAVSADEAPSWGAGDRDTYLRRFWRGEPFLASAVYSLCARNAGFRWQIETDDERLKLKATELLKTAEFHEGWPEMILKVSEDLYTQDNGGMIEVIRPSRTRIGGKDYHAVKKRVPGTSFHEWYAVLNRFGDVKAVPPETVFDSPMDMPIGLAHLDASKCIRTGSPDRPILYMDRFGKQHYLNSWQVITMSDMPSPIEEMHGVGFCMVSRVFRNAQTVRDWTIYREEKISGRFARAVHLTNVDSDLISDAIQQAQTRADSQGLLRYSQPIITNTLDPSARPWNVTIPLAELPENWDEDTMMRWYVGLIALAAGEHYSFFAPMPGRRLGSAREVEVQERQARGKSSRLFMEMIVDKFKNAGIFPDGCALTFEEKDPEEQAANEEAADRRANTRAIRIASGEITPEIARQIAVDIGDLKEDYLRAIGEQDITPEEGGDGEGDAGPDVQGGQNIPGLPEGGATEITFGSKEDGITGEPPPAWGDKEVEISKEDIARAVGKWNERLPEAADGILLAKPATEDQEAEEIEAEEKGGSRSGYHTPHFGRPGKRGGSQERDPAMGVVEGGPITVDIIRSAEEAAKMLREVQGTWTGARRDTAIMATTVTGEWNLKGDYWHVMRDEGELVGIARIDTDPDNVPMGEQDKIYLSYVATKRKGYGTRLCMGVGIGALRQNKGIAGHSAYSAKSFYQLLGLPMHHSTLAISIPLDQLQDMLGQFGLKAKAEEVEQTRDMDDKALADAEPEDGIFMVHPEIAEAVEASGIKGSADSGYWNKPQPHFGRPGKVGGSTERSHALDLVKKGEWQGKVPKGGKPKPKAEAKPKPKKQQTPLERGYYVKPKAPPKPKPKPKPEPEEPKNIPIEDTTAQSPPSHDVTDKPLGAYGPDGEMAHFDTARGVHTDAKTQEINRAFTDATKDALYSEDESSWYGNPGWRVTEPSRRSEIKHRIVSELAQQTGVSYAAINDYVKSWASTSNDKNPMSLLVQLAASLELQTTPSSWQMQKLLNAFDGASIEQIQKVNTGELARMRKYVRAVYENTQKALREWGLKPDDEVVLFRGGSIAKKAGQSLTAGDVVNYRGNALESWSLSHKVADIFDSTFKSDERQGVIVSARIPVSRIVSTSLTGMGCVTEGEIIIAGSGGDLLATVESAYGELGQKAKKERVEIVFDDEGADDWMKALPSYKEEVGIHDELAKKHGKKGGEGSGHYQHRGRPGSVGGSAPTPGGSPQDVPAGPGGPEGAEVGVGITSARPGKPYEQVLAEMRAFAAKMKAAGIKNVRVIMGRGGWQGGWEPTWVTSYDGNGAARDILIETAKEHNQDAILIMNRASAGSEGATPRKSISFGKMLSDQEIERIEQEVVERKIGGWTWYNGTRGSTLMMSCVAQWGCDSGVHQRAMDDLLADTDIAPYNVRSWDSWTRNEVVDRSEYDQELGLVEANDGQSD